MSNGNVITLGQNYTIKGALSKPKNYDSTATNVGIVIVGMGIAEVQIARRLRRLGFIVLQIRLIEDSETFNNAAKQRAIYDQTGVARIQETMDFLTENYGVEKFFLMGTCAGANVSLNTALQDARVIGLVPVNLHFSELLTHDVKIKQKLFSWKKWKLLLSGKANYSRLRKYIIGKIKRSSPSEMVAQWEWSKDMLLPVNFDEVLEDLTQRGVDILMVYSETEDSLAYFEKMYHGMVNKLSPGGRFTLKVIERDTHVFSQDDVSAGILNDIVNDWFKGFVPARA